MTDLTQEPVTDTPKSKAWTEAHYQRGRRDGLLECARKMHEVLADLGETEFDCDAFRTRLALCALDIFAEATSE